MYAHMVAGADEEGHKEFDSRLYAPADGWAAAQGRFFDIIQGEG